MADTTPEPRWPSINPTWVGILVMLVINISAIAVKYAAIEDHGVRLKALEVKDASRDVQQAELRSDMTYIKERLSEIRAEIRAAVSTPAAPAQVVYPQYPPQSGYPVQQQPRRGAQVAPRTAPRLSPPVRRRRRAA